MSRQRVAIAVGHHPEKRGASWNGWSEYELLAPVAGYLVRELTRAGLDAYLVPSGRLATKVEWINAGNFTAAVELHGDAGGGSGGTALYYPGSTAGQALAEAVDNAMEAVLGADRRRARPGYFRGDPARGVLYFLARTACPAVVVEPEYLRARLDTFRDNPQAIAQGIAAGVSWALQKGTT